MPPDSTPPGAHDAGSKYRVLLELGQGPTTGTFLAATRKPGGNETLVVLKALKRSLAADLEVRRSFLHQARLAARLLHPNIVAVTEIVEREGVPVLVMEHLEGQTLFEIIRRAGRHLTPRVHLRLVADALRGLHYLHALTDLDGTPLRLVHRNVTPHNLVVTYDGVVKILDFGAVGVVTGATETPADRDKLRYMPPEQITSEEMDRRTDIFATGVMLWEAAAGDSLWRDMGEATIMNRVINGEIPSPRGVRPDCSERLERICMKAMAYRKEDRYATAAELELELERLLGEMGPPVTQEEVGQFVQRHFRDTRRRTQRIIDDKRRDSVSLPLSATGRISMAPGSINAPSFGLAPRPSRRKRVVIALVGLISLALAGVALGLLTRPQARPQPVPSAPRIPITSAP